MSRKRTNGSSTLCSISASRSERKSTPEGLTYVGRPRLKVEPEGFACVCDCPNPQARLAASAWRARGGEGTSDLRLSATLGVCGCGACACSCGACAAVGAVVAVGATAAAVAYRARHRAREVRPCPRVANLRQRLLRACPVAKPILRERRGFERATLRAYSGTLGGSGSRRARVRPQGVCDRREFATAGSLAGWNAAALTGGEELAEWREMIGSRAGRLPPPLRRETTNGTRHENNGCIHAPVTKGYRLRHGTTPLER